MKNLLIYLYNDFEKNYYVNNSLYLQSNEVLKIFSKFNYFRFETALFKINVIQQNSYSNKQLNVVDFKFKNVNSVVKTFKNVYLKYRYKINTKNNF